MNKDQSKLAVPMFCINCETESQFKTEEVDLEQIVNGMTYKVKSSVTICTVCGYKTLTAGQTNELLKRTKQQIEGDVKMNPQKDSDWIIYLKETNNYEGYDALCQCYACKAVRDGFDEWKAKRKGDARKAGLYESNKDERRGAEFIEDAIRIFKFLSPEDEWPQSDEDFHTDSDITAVAAEINNVVTKQLSTLRTQNEKSIKALEAVFDENPDLTEGTHKLIFAAINKQK